MADSTIVDHAADTIQKEIAGTLRKQCQSLPSAMEIKSVRPARPDPYARASARAGIARALTHWCGQPHGELARALREPMLERAIGVVDRPETAFLSHCLEAILTDQFDAYVGFEATTAVTPLPSQRRHGATETYRFGL